MIFKKQKNIDYFIKFDPIEKIYKAYDRNNDEIKKLSRDGKKIILKKNKELLKNPELIKIEIKKIVISKRFRKLQQLGFSCTSFEVLNTTRTNENISNEMLNFLNKLTNEKNTLIGIHRTGNSGLDDIANILKYGFILSKLDGNTTNSEIKLNNNFSYYPDNQTIIKEIVNADSYKKSLGSIIIRIPDEDLSQNIFLIDTESENVILNPKYVIGFIPVCKNGTITEIITSNTLSNGIFKSIDTLYEKRDYARNINVEEKKL